MNYDTLASPELLEQTAAALKSRNFEPIVVDTKAQALEKVRTLIPAGVSIMNGASRTLEEIGFVEYLKSGTHGWNNLHEKVLAEKDPAIQGRLRREAAISDVYLGSVHALAATGEMVIASNTGSQLPNIVYGSPQVIFVVSTQKIVPTLADALDRLERHVIPLEDNRMKEAYGIGTQHNKTFIYRGENTQFTGRTIHVILVKEKLGF